MKQKKIKRDDRPEGSMKKKLVSILVIALALIFFSCGEDKEDDRYQYNMINFFNTYLQTLCKSAATCNSGFVNATNVAFCPDIILNYTEPFSGFHKKENVIFRQKFELMKSGETMGFVLVDMDQAEICLKLIEDSTALCNPFDVQLLDIPECAKIFSGTKYIKQDCYQDEECFNGWCDTSGDRCPGSCVEYKQADQDCNSSLDKCIPGYTCRTSGCSKSSDGKAGEPCTSDDGCSSFLFCKIDDGDAIGNCFKKVGEGAVCLEENECVEGLACVNNQCTSSRVGNEVGSKCGTEEPATEEDEPIEYTCNIFSKLECGPQNSCQKLSNQPNYPCTTMCDKSLYCDLNLGVCQYQGDIGRPCSVNEQCTSMYCLNGVCVIPECLESVEEE